ncbi:MAG TPA: glycosyltransferase family 87 protein [Planctomycetota bacterium]
MQLLRSLQKPGQWLPWLCGLVAAGIAARNLIGAYADLGIYLEVAREFREGGVDICRNRPSSGPWVYPHFAALPFVALLAVFGEVLTRWIWCLLLGLGTALLLRSVARCVAMVGGLRWWQWLAFGVLFQRCLAQNLTHGQLSLWVGTFVAGGVVHLLQRRDLRGGVWLGLAAALKLTPLLFLLALPLMRRPRAAGSMLATVLAAVLLVPWPFCGTAEHARHLADFWRTIAESIGAPEHAAIVQAHAGPSVGGTLDYLLQARAVNREGHTVNVADLGEQALQIVKLAWSAVLGGLLLLWFWRARRHPDPSRLAIQSSAVMLAIVFFAPLVRVYHLAAAMLPFALFCRGPRGARDVLWWITALAVLFSLTLRQRKLLGETLWRNLDAGGLLHFALVGMLVWLLRESRSARPESP